jgi:hypothetical protein
MNTLFNKLLFLSLIIFSSLVMQAQTGSYISFTQKTEVLENKKKATSEVEVYFDNSKRTITKHFYSPKEFMSVTNPLGEVKTYFPSTNEVNYQQMQELASVRNLIYYFANNLTDHLGLADEGFTLVSNTYEGSYYVTLWKAPPLLKGIDTVKMAFENGVPVYSEYTSTDGKTLKKIFYTNYNDYTSFRLPAKIIEIAYLPNGDSTVNRTIFSNVKVSSIPESEYFNFKIPDDAKPIVPAKTK